MRQLNPVRHKGLRPPKRSNVAFGASHATKAAFGASHATKAALGRFRDQCSRASAGTNPRVAPSKRDTWAAPTSKYIPVSRSAPRSSAAATTG